jgi:hypothetical protein
MDSTFLPLRVSPLPLGHGGRECEHGGGPVGSVVMMVVDDPPG